MFIVLKRKITSEMMTTYFPTIMLTAITFATTFFKPYFFEAALTVNLTTMLVMTTIFISKMDGLPPTSAIKMIDIWLILCQLVPFCEVVLLTAIEYNSKGEQGKNGKKTKTINHHGEMRVVNLEDESKAGKEGAANEKPVSAWRPLQKDGNSLGVLSLKSVRKYQLQSEHSYCHRYYLPSGCFPQKWSFFQSWLFWEWSSTALWLPTTISTPTTQLTSNFPALH